MPLDVVAGVDDHGQVARRDGQLQAVRELRPARPAGEGDDLHVRSRSWTSGIRRMVSGSYGPGMRTMTVSNPRSRYGRSASATAAGVPSRTGPGPMCSAPLWSSRARKAASAAAGSSRRMQSGS